MAIGRSFSVQYGVPQLLVYCFAKLDPYLKGKFNKVLLGTKLLDRVLYEMMEDGLFPEWFRDALSFNHLYGQLDGLRVALTVAVQDLLIKRDATRFDYHFINFAPDELADMIRPLGIDDASARRLANELNKRLRNAG